MYIMSCEHKVRHRKYLENIWQFLRKSDGLWREGGENRKDFAVQPVCWWRSEACENCYQITFHRLLARKELKMVLCYANREDWIWIAGSRARSISKDWRQVITLKRMETRHVQRFVRLPAHKIKRERVIHTFMKLYSIKCSTFVFRIRF